MSAMIKPNKTSDMLSIGSRMRLNGIFNFIGIFGLGVRLLAMRLMNYLPSFDVCAWLCQSRLNQNFATYVVPHQFDILPSGLLKGLMVPPGTALGSPVRTKQFSFDKLVSE